jgi:hypothetical protein
MDKLKRATFKNPSDLPGADKGKKPEPFSPGNIIWDKDSVIDLVYEVAPKVFQIKRFWFDGTTYTQEDFTQDAALFIWEKMEEGYLDLTAPHLESIIFTLLSNYFIYNKARSLTREKNIHSLDDKISRDGSEEETSRIDTILDDNLTSEDIALISNAIIHGESIIKKLISELNLLPFQSRSKNYKGTFRGKSVELSERSLMRMFFSGMSLKQIQNAFDSNIATEYSKARLVEKKFKQTLEKMVRKINNLDEDDRFDVKLYALSKSPVGVDLSTILSRSESLSK